MPDPTSPPSSPQPDDLRLVLFGMPAAGKSSLLGALSRAAETQEHLLGGKLTDESQGLAELRQQVYDSTPRRTPEEVVPYPIIYQPLVGEGQTRPAATLDAVLMDCDGRVANDLLLRRKELAENSPEGTLAHEVLDADTLILVIDASAPPTQVESDFTEFARFLASMERGRTERTEVSGLPVFLVLTKCDLLARPGDSPADWMDRIEQRKREVDAHFREFLGRGDDAKPRAAEPKPEAPARDVQEIESPFGRIELHIWATAVKRPELAGSPAKPREPYQVAELFRQCMKAATLYRARTRRADRRMWLLVGTMAALLLGLIGLTATMWFTNRANWASVLATRIDDYRLYNTGTAAHRLTGTPADLRAKLDRLEGFRDDPQYPRLKPEQRAFVEERIAELKGYLDWYEKLLKERPLTEQSEAGLKRRLEHLRADLKLPDDEWQGTRGGELHRAMLESSEALQAAVEKARDWYLASRDSAAKRWAFAGYPEGAIDWADWTLQAQRLLDPARMPPFNELDPLPGDAGLTYANALRFDSVGEARTKWEAERAKLKRLLDVTSALALATPSKERPALLIFPRGFTVEQASDRVEELRSFYPDYLKTFARSELPEAIVPRVRQVAGNQYQALLDPARAEVLRQYELRGKGTAETVEKWEAVRKWLKSPTELASWRTLVRVLLRLQDTDPSDPVRHFADFLDKTEFVLQPKTLVLEVPQGQDVTPRAEANLEVYHPQSGRQPALKYVPYGEPEEDRGRRVRLYTFRLSGGDRILFKPGDNLWAVLNLSGGKERLAWVEARSSLYRIERLMTTPRVQPVQPKAIEEGRSVEGVRLVARPDEGLPRVPDLMPAMRE